MKTYVFQKTHHRSTIPKYSRIETIQMSISSKTDKYIVLYSHHRIHDNENKCSTTMFNNIEGSSKHVEWKKTTHIKERMLCHSTVEKGTSNLYF